VLLIKIDGAVTETSEAHLPLAEHGPRPEHCLGSTEPPCRKMNMQRVSQPPGNHLRRGRKLPGGMTVRAVSEAWDRP